MSDQKRRNRNVALCVFAGVAIMIGLSFASVPLYSLFCRTTGYDGTPRIATAAADRILDRAVTVRFNTDVAPELPWVFQPEIRQLKVRLGEQALVSFHAENEDSKPHTGTALYNVTPEKVGKYFNKIQCFCFGEQTLEAGKSASMPVIFYIDPAFDKDPNMDDVTTITLSYTFFKADSPGLEKAVDALYNGPGDGAANNAATQ